MGDYRIAAAQRIQFRNSDYLRRNPMICSGAKRMDIHIIYNSARHHMNHERGGFLLFCKDIRSDVSRESERQNDQSEWNKITIRKIFFCAIDCCNHRSCRSSMSDT